MAKALAIARTVPGRLQHEALVEWRSISVSAGTSEMVTTVTGDAILTGGNKRD